MSSRPKVKIDGWEYNPVSCEEAALLLKAHFMTICYIYFAMSYFKLSKKVVEDRCQIYTPGWLVGVDVTSIGRGPASKVLQNC